METELHNCYTCGMVSKTVCMRDANLAFDVGCKDWSPRTVIRVLPNDGNDMTTDRDIVDRLRDSQPKGTYSGYLLNDAADEITRLRAVSVSAQRMLEAWDAKTPLAWQPENNVALLEDLRSALVRAQK